MEAINRRVIFGLILVGAGILFLLQSLNIFMVYNLAWAILFALGGTAFLFVLVQNRENWWAAIPGLTLLAIGVMIFLSDLAPELSDRLGGAIILGAIGLSFWIVYFMSPANWWAIIPGGVMLTLTGITLIDNLVSFDTGGLFFLGLAATFALVYLLPAGRKMQWALIPAAILGVIGILILAAASSLAAWFWPVALITTGLFLIYRAYGR